MVGDGMASAPGPNPLGEFIRLNGYGTLASALLIAVANAVFFGEPAIYLLPGAVLITFFTLRGAARLHAAQQVPEALGVIAFGNWAVAIVAVYMLPWLLPVVVLTSMMPIVLATPYVRAARLWPFMVGTAVVLATIGWLGIERDDDGLIDDIADGVELGIVVVGLIANAIPIGVVVWQANRYHRAQADDAIRLSDELSESRRRLVVAGDDERARIERDLHDGAQQRLIAAAMRLRMIDGRSESADLAPVISEVESAMADIRRLANGLSPALLESAGLDQALSASAREASWPVETHLEPVGRLDRSVETALYFCGTEAMQNALKHAGGRQLRLDLRRAAGEVVLEVTDAGDGFDVETATSSRGMVNMSDRIASVGGTLTVASRPGAGTTVRATVPASASRRADERSEVER